MKLPVGKDYYCDQDDLYIYNERKANDVTWTLSNDEETSTTTATVNGNNVTLAVSFGENITVTISGITQDVIDEFTEKSGDITGINFDVYNYFLSPKNPKAKENPEWDLSGLWSSLNNGSTISFTGGNPSYYVNTINQNYVLDKVEGDEVAAGSVISGCTVKADEDNFKLIEDEQNEQTINHVQKNVYTSLDSPKYVF